MDISNWVPAISTTSLLIAVVWLCRNLIITRLTNSVRYEYESKLELLRTELRNSTEILKNDLRIKESEINTLRSGALSAMASRQIEYDKRRLRAIDDLWAAVAVGLAPAKAASSMMVSVVFDEAAKEAEENKILREMFMAMGKGFDISKIKTIDPSASRPYVTPIAWALYKAYSSIVSSALIKFEILKAGLSPKILNKEVILNVVKSALPHYTEYLDKYGVDASHLLLDELEERLLDELKSMLIGAESDKVSVQRSAEILKHAKSLVEESNKDATQLTG